MIRYTSSYLLRRLTKAAVPLMWPTSEDYLKRSSGKIDFYGSKTFVELCIKALDEELVKYDAGLKLQICQTNWPLCFYDGEKRAYLSYPTAGVFTIPEKVWRFKEEGICQFIVFRYLQTLETGTGFTASAKLKSRRDYLRRLQMASVKMISWLERTNYPKRWIGCYTKSASRAEEFQS
jgi:hypothetical protein